MNARAIRAIVNKDLRVVGQSKGVLIPLIILPVFMFVLLPAAIGMAPYLYEGQSIPITGLDTFIANMPDDLFSELRGLNEAQTIIVLTLVYFFAPLYLIVPLMVSSVIAADSFAGEKERKTLEPLLYSPTSDGELFLSKMLSAWIPAVAVSWGGFIIYAIVANAAAWPTMSHIFFPNLTWLTMAIWVAPAVAGLGLGATVLVSARVQTFQEAYQIGAIVVLPIVALIIGQGAGVIYFSAQFALLLGLVVWIIDIAILSFGSHTFKRGQILARV